MDRALDEVIGDRQRENRNRGGGRNRPRRDDWARDGARKNGGDRSNIDDDWIHDKYEDNDEGRRSRRAPRGRSYRDRSPEPDLMDQGAKLRVENLHYELTEDDIEDLFTRIAPVTSFTLTYDRAGRSTGTAYVTYRSVASARSAIREYDGANARGEPIRVSLVPSGPSGNRGGGRNPFDSAVKPGRSLFDRIEGGKSGGSRGRDRSRSPRRSDVTKPPPDGIDRYIPSRSRSPPPRRRDVNRSGDRRNDSRRGDGGRRGGGPRRGGGGGDRPTVQGRPRKTQEELDAEMDNYWNSNKGDDASASAAPAAQSSAAAPVDDDIDMVE